MIAVPSTWRDVSKYYEGTYIKLPEYGDMLFFVQRVRESMITGINEDDTVFEIHLNEKAPFHLDYILPHRAVFQFGQDAVSLRRVPARQYRRGLHSDNTKIVSVTNGEGYPLSFDLLKAFVNKQKYVLLSEALEDRGTFRSVALTSRMSYVRAGRELRIDNTTVAVISKAERIIKMTRPIFSKEIKQYLQDNSLTYGVI